MLPHNLFNDDTKSRESRAPKRRRLHPTPRLNRRPRNASTNRRVPNVMLPPILLNDALTTGEDPSYEGEILTPIETLLGGCSGDGTTLLGDGGDRQLTAPEDGYGRIHVGHGAEEDTHRETH